MTEQELRRKLRDKINDCVNKQSFTSQDLNVVLALIKEVGYVKLADIRKAIAIEFRKAVDESKTNPFGAENLNREHNLLWKGHANAYSEVISYLDKQTGGK